MTEISVYAASDERLMELAYAAELAGHRLSGALHQVASYSHNVPPYLAAEIAQREIKAALAADALEAHEATYTGWSRFWLVQAVGGHIHRTRACSTCFATTKFALLTSLSGMTEAEAVAEHGAILCTVCFPTAPVEWTGGEAKAVIAAREEREAAKAERAAKKEAKRLIPGSDEGFVVGATPLSHRRLVTSHSAKAWLTDEFLYDKIYGRGTSPEIHAVAALLVGRPGIKEVSAEEVLAAAEKRAAKQTKGMVLAPRQDT
jgi:hypothetical protein